jgi:hypothetical protein
MRDFFKERDDWSYSAARGAISSSGPYSAANYCRILTGGINLGQLDKGLDEFADSRIE